MLGKLLVVVTVLGEFLAGQHRDISRDLADRREFRGTPAAPAHEKAFTLYQDVVGRRLAKKGSPEARAAWAAILAAPPEARAAQPGFADLLRDYAMLRYGPDVAAAAGQLIRCRTYSSPGAEPGSSSDTSPEYARARGILDSLAAAHGFEASTHSGGLAIVLAAGSGADTLGLWGHLDVVPADTAGWSFDPWSGRIVDGVLQGRGAIDDKAPFAAALFAIRALRDTGVPLRSRVQLFGGFAEETTWDDINGYLREQPAPRRNIVIDAGFPVTVAEKGLVTLTVASSFKRMPLRSCREGFVIRELSGGVAANVVPDRARIRLSPLEREFAGPAFLLGKKVGDFNAENSRAHLTISKSPATKEITIEAAGKSAHGSAPGEGHNAIIDLAEFMYGLARTCYQPSHWIICFLHEYVGGEISGRGLGIAARDSLMGETTVNAGVVASSADSTFVKLGIRFPRGLTADRVFETVRDRIVPFNQRFDAGLAVSREWRGFDPVFTDPRDPMVTALLETYAEVYGRPGQPTSTPGTSYAKRLPHVVGFGPEMPGEPVLSHAPDERISLEDLNRLTAAYATAVLKLAATP